MATVTLLASGINSDVAVSSFNTTTFTPGTNCAIVLLVGGMCTTSAACFGTGISAAPSGGSSPPSFTRRANYDPAAAWECGSAIFSAEVGGTSTGTWSISVTTGAGNFGSYAWAVYRVTGYDTASPFAGAVCQDGPANNATTLTLGATPSSGDAVLALSYADSNADGGATFGSPWSDATNEDWDATGSGTSFGSANAGNNTATTSTSVPWSDVNTSTGNYSSSQAAIIVKNAGGATYDETGLATTLAFTTSVTDVQAYDETDLPTTLAFTTSITDVQVYDETDLATTLTFTTSITDVQVYDETDLATTITFTTNIIDITFAYPASVSGREILDQNGNPWPLKGVAVWTATQNLSDANITTLLEGLQARGLNFVLMAPCGLTWHSNSGKYVNAAGDPFFATTPDGTTADTPFSGHLGAAWSSVDHFVDECQRLELTVGLCHYAGFGTDDTPPSTDTFGQAPEWLDVTDGQMQTYGTRVAERYPASAYPHLVWVYSADRNFTSASNVASRLDALAQGIVSVDTSRLQMAHPDKRDDGNYTSGENQFGTGYTYVNPAINTEYSYQSERVDEFDSIYAEATMPVVDIEPVYVHNTSTEVGTNPITHGTGNGQHLREQAWTAFCRGGNGIVHGDEDLWPFGATGLYSGGGTWQEVLDDTDGTHDDPLIWLEKLWDFLATFPGWSDLTPDAGTFLTGGLGTGSAKAAVGFDPDLAVVYFPDSRGSITIDTTQMTGTGNVRLRWYDPCDGSYTVIAASEAQTASRSITYPTSNSNSNSSDDWVLVVDLVVGTVYDETGLATTITFTTSVTDVQTYQETALPTTIALTTSVTDLQTYDEVALPTTITLTTSISDIQTYDETGLATTLAFATSITDSMTYQELGLATVLTFTTTITDDIGTVYDETGLATTITFTTTVTDQQTYDELGLPTTIAFTTSITDQQTYFELGLATTITLTTSITDSVEYDELGLATAIAFTTSVTDDQLYLELNLPTTIQLTTSITDTLEFDELGLFTQITFTTQYGTPAIDGEGMQVVSTMPTGSLTSGAAPAFRYPADREQSTVRFRDDRFKRNQQGRIYTP